MCENLSAVCVDPAEYYLMLDALEFSFNRAPANIDESGRFSFLEGIRGNKLSGGE